MFRHLNGDWCLKILKKKSVTWVRRHRFNPSNLNCQLVWLLTVHKMCSHEKVLQNEKNKISYFFSLKEGINWLDIYTRTRARAHTHTQIILNENINTSKFYGMIESSALPTLPVLKTRCALRTSRGLFPSENL